MLISFEYKGRQAYAFTVYNFSQVRDAVLLVLADKKQQKSTMLFMYSDGTWETSEDLSFLSVNSFEQINNALTRLFKSYMGSDFFINILGNENMTSKPEYAMNQLT